MTVLAELPDGPDPRYSGRAAQWLRWITENFLNIQVLVDERLKAPVAADRGAQVMWLRPGHDFPDFQHYVSRACAYIALGDRFVPEFRQNPVLQPAASSDALVIPFPRKLHIGTGQDLPHPHR